MTLPPFPFLPASPEERLRLTQYGELCARMAVRLPQTAAEVRDFVGSDFCSLNYGAEDRSPSDDDLYAMTAHDIISAFSSWDAARSGGKGDGE